MAGRRWTKDSPSIVKKKVKMHSISDNQPIATEMYYKGTRQFCNIHPALTVPALTAGHLILRRIGELDALSKEAEHKVRLCLF